VIPIKLINDRTSAIAAKIASSRELKRMNACSSCKISFILRTPYTGWSGSSVASPTEFRLQRCSGRRRSSPAVTLPLPGLWTRPKFFVDQHFMGELGVAKDMNCKPIRAWCLLVTFVPLVALILVVR
jgi:hypothetical protein